ncbi:Hypothetical Protein FCC1311_097742 [Hondaea fermentalgiana]|uniref:Uncharacterized protein n=1 Tax=Hondaea fermentalgiana TaxID=2315210 RepID=A0A2R5GYL1_9STRA|nr:Hypothetical Protein FCC1311_097742 [Hondaea fermentalgiana]|eukprot:GBG33551.1 Hypothetical Protein FCC1311_097742 [Hondaea fermentalgiana]
MDLVLSTPSSGQLSFQDVNRSIPTLRFSVNQASSSQGDTLIGLTGTVTSLNYALQHLHYIVPAARREDTVTLYVLDESRDIGPASFNVDDLNEKAVEGSGYVVDTELEVYFDNAVDTQSFAVGAVVLWASIIGATLLCCGCVYSVVHAVVRRALMGERAAMWIVRNVFFTHITDAKDEDLTPEARRLSRIAMTRIHAEEVTMTRVFCCLHLLACLCPCCIKFKGDKTMLPTKDAMLAATVSDLSHGMAKKHLPGDAAPRITELTTREAMEYEEHEVVTNDGRVRKYLFNPHTGRSLWMANVRIVHSAHGPNSSSDDSD